MVLSALFDSQFNLVSPVQVVDTWVLLYSGHYIKTGELCSSVSSLKSNSSCLDVVKSRERASYATWWWEKGDFTWEKETTQNLCPFGYPPCFLLSYGTLSYGTLSTWQEQLLVAQRRQESANIIFLYTIEIVIVNLLFIKKKISPKPVLFRTPKYSKVNALVSLVTIYLVMYSKTKKTTTHKTCKTNTKTDKQSHPTSTCYACQSGPL